MPYGTMLADTFQTSTANTTPVIKDGNSAEIGRLIRSWIYYNGSTQVILGSYNVSSVTRAGTGIYYCYFSITMSSANYSTNGSAASWACQAGAGASNYYVLNSFVTTSGSSSDQIVNGMVASS